MSNRYQGEPQPSAASYTIKELPSPERPRERLIAHGPSQLSTAELLAILLRTGTKGESALNLASRLLASTGGIERLAGMRPAELASIKGVGMAKAAQILAALELGRRARTAPFRLRPAVSRPEDIAPALSEWMAHLDQEEFHVVFLDVRNRVIAETTLYRGNATSSVVRPAEVFREALRHNAVNLIVAHNHPSGDPTPSAEDVAITKVLVEAGKLMGIDLLDHLIIGRSEWRSLRALGLGF